MTDLFLNIIPNAILAGIGVYIIITALLKDLIPGNQTATVLTAPGQFDPDMGGNACFAMHLPLRVILDDNSVTTAYISACNMCMNSVKQGDRVCLDTSGDCLTAKKIMTAKKNMAGRTS
ncbi:MULTISPECIES: hypothetical protein [Desulfobacula]|nr:MULTISPECIES: hypothetical protein [Desulfobacula]SDT84343.1 hypothetical protein SAMN04487931_101209 [Desulfobacula phenolica]